jgi:hypothetical protein
MFSYFSQPTTNANANANASANTNTNATANTTAHADDKSSWYNQGMQYVNTAKKAVEQSTRTINQITKMMGIMKEINDDPKNYLKILSYNKTFIEEFLQSIGLKDFYENNKNTNYFQDMLSIINDFFDSGTVTIVTDSNIQTQITNIKEEMNKILIELCINDNMISPDFDFFGTPRQKSPKIITMEKELSYKSSKLRSRLITLNKEIQVLKGLPKTNSISYDCSKEKVYTAGRKRRTRKQHKNKKSNIKSNTKKQYKKAI